MEGTLATFLADVTTTASSLQGLTGGWFNIVTEEPALFVMIIGMPLTGYGVGLLQRLFRLG